MYHDADNALVIITCELLNSRASRRYPVRLHRSSASFFFFQAEDGIRDLTVTGVQTCALPILRALLEKGAYANAKDNNGWTALMSAAASPRAEAVEALLEKGAEVNAQDKTGWTALMGAASSGQAESVRALLGKGADRNARNSDGNTALTVARSHNYSEIVALLENPSASTPASASKRSEERRVGKECRSRW